MRKNRLTFPTKLLSNLPWLLRYPAWRAKKLLDQADSVSTKNLIFVIANHFEPAYNEDPNEKGSLGIPLSEVQQLPRLDRWCEEARKLGEAVKDHDGMPFRHTNFYPAEQYHKSLINRLAELQKDGFGEVEIHLHHGVDHPDTADNFRRVIVGFRDVLAEEHGCLSRSPDNSYPMYGFVHGNWALANSAGGKFCGVDSEMAILRDSGCYADFTLPSAPDKSQVPRINAIYQCGGPLDRRVPHYEGPSLKVGQPRPSFPILFTGPLRLDFRSGPAGLPVPRLENGALTARGPLNLHRVALWQQAGVGVVGKPEWVFIKLYCHGFFPNDQPVLIGDDMRIRLEELLEFAEKQGNLRIHFATAREAFNMVLAAVDGQPGQPGDYRDYYLRSNMDIARQRAAIS